MPLRLMTAAFAAAQPRLTRLDMPVARRRGCGGRRMQGVVRYPEKLSPALAYELILGSGKPGFVPALDALTSYDFRDRLGRDRDPRAARVGRERHARARRGLRRASSG